MFGKKGKKARGSELIAQTLGGFDSMIADLELGYSDCEASIDVNKNSIRQLQDVNEALSKDRSRAITVMENLKQLVADC